MPADLYHSPVPEQLWERIRNEFHLPSLDQVRERFSAMQEDPEPVIRELVRVFLDGGTYCPGYQFRPDLTLEPVVVKLFERAMELRIPHNYFALWMMVPSPALQGKWPVDLRRNNKASALLVELDRTFAGRAA
ncbi:hypothetical protein [Paenarthrobacter nitroguajacolicus]|uniref:hypothetical protein n=1 Tax=Paenarthrobacter nitroguajacolicus TaxID=211146 RepID=UPI00285A9B4B|nr:hypothetical protein [Paenarthrobacter nitroguajacolicus]MDR6639595.1 hypothetical protein [Paenarthrobacter nitroguajacolicus]